MGRKHSVDPDVAAAMYNEQQSLASIAKALGVSKGTVSNALKRAGQQPRDRIEAVRSCAKGGNKVRKYASSAEKQRAYRLADPDHHRAKRREWDKNNRAKKNESQRAWRAKNIEADRTRMRKIRAQRQSASGSHTVDDVKEIFAAQSGRCACCRKKIAGVYHVDHITPLKLGGSNNRRNLQVLCPACNLSKGCKPPHEFMRDRGFLL